MGFKFFSFYVMSDRERLEQRKKNRTMDSVVVMAKHLNVIFHILACIDQKFRFNSVHLLVNGFGCFPLLSVIVLFPLTNKSYY